MTPRSYDLGRRKETADRTRQRILKAAGALLAAKRGPSDFSVDAVAKRAGVARQTVYDQFGSRRRLIEALFTGYGRSGDISSRLASAMAESHPLERLNSVIAAYAAFWQTGRVLVRRIRAMAILDPDLGGAMEARHTHRRRLLASLIDAIEEGRGPSPAGIDATRGERENALFVVTSFETFDALAGDRPLEEAVPTVVALAHAIVRRS